MYYWVALYCALGCAVLFWAAEVITAVCPNVINIILGVLVERGVLLLWRCGEQNRDKRFEIGVILALKQPQLHGTVECNESLQ